MLYDNGHDDFKTIFDMCLDEFVRMDHFYDPPQPSDMPVIVYVPSVVKAKTVLKPKLQRIEYIEFEEVS